MTNASYCKFNASNGIITVVEKTFVTQSEQETHELGRKIGAHLKGGEVIILQSDLGGGKTAITRGVAIGIGSTAHVTSPTFTIQQIYIGNTLRIYHYDFYRMAEIGLMQEELSEALNDEKGVVIIEWAGTAGDLVEENRLVTIKIDKDATDSEKRTLEISCSDILSYIFGQDR